MRRWPRDYRHADEFFVAFTADRKFVDFQSFVMPMISCYKFIRLSKRDGTQFERHDRLIL
jgi:hypothetical protein